MLESDFKISSETFQTSLSNGFSKLQQMQEFVDVTLAAGGHFVKAHQNILAVASPYLKELMKSTPCQHPVIFLGVRPINPRVLCFILEYIYTGEVNVPGNELPHFAEAAKLLHIAGIKDMLIPQVGIQINENSLKNKKAYNFSTKTITPDGNKQNNIDLEASSELNKDNSNYYVTKNSEPFPIIQPIDNDKCDMDFENLITVQNIPKCSDVDTLTLRDQINNDSEENYLENDACQGIYSEIDSQAYAPTSCLDDDANDGVSIIPIKPIAGFNDCNNVSGVTKTSNKLTTGFNDRNNVSEISETSNKPRAGFNDYSDVSVVSNTSNGNKESNATPIYTRSNRGSLQMVINRFIYYLHHTSNGKQKRRWRCINYRKYRCPAYVDTNGEIIIGRKNSHNHPFQDKEILKIGRRKEFYTSIAEVNNRCCQHQQDPKKSNTDDNIGHESQYKINIVIDQPMHTNSIAIKK